ncbi:MAG: hypothetical protein HYZ20_12060 [Burkholderiales bacterium]|nr:hypothetical protein [Burkholderiales bacterium]
MRILRRQLEALIAERHGAEHLAMQNRRTELRQTVKAIAALRKQLASLGARKAELEATCSGPIGDAKGRH